MTGVEFIKFLLKYPRLLNCEVVIRNPQGEGPIWLPIRVRAGVNIFIIEPKEKSR